MFTLHQALPITLNFVSIIASVAGFLVTLYLYGHSYRGDIAVVSLTAVYATFLAIFASSGISLLKSIANATVSMICFVGTMVLVTITYRLSPLHPLYNFPGPLLNKITALKSAYVVWAGKRWLVVKDMHERYGRFVRTGPNTISINSYDAIMPIYTSAHCMDKSEAYRPGRSPHGGLFFVRGRDEHNVRRRIWAPAFSTSSVESMMDVVNKRTKQMIQCMHRRRDKNNVLDMTTVIRHWSFDLMGEITFGQSSRIELMEDGDQTGIVSSVQNGGVAFELFGEVPPLFDIVWYLPVTKDFHVFSNTSAKLMKLRKKNQSQTQGNDISSYLLGEHGGEPLNDEELELDSAFSVIAGSDTTAGTITFLIYYLLSDRKVYAKLRAELDAHFNSPDDITDFKALQDLPYLYGVVHEGLRLGTPFPGLPRVIPKGGCVLDSVYVPEGTTVGVPPYVQQTSPENFYPRPLEFLPERWQPEGLGPDTVTRKSAIMCFSFGPFSCLGKAFAIQELHLAIAKLVLAFDMDLAPDFDHDLFNQLTYNMRTTVFTYPLMITATPRD